MKTFTAKSGKKYTAKQKQLDESLFGGDPIKKFFKELENALDTGRPVLLGTSQKNGNTLVISSYRHGSGRVTFYADGKESMKPEDFIHNMLKAGVKAKDIKEIQVVFSSGNTSDGSYPIAGVTTMDTRNGIIVIADVASAAPKSATSKFFSEAGGKAQLDENGSGYRSALIGDLFIKVFPDNTIELGERVFNGPSVRFKVDKYDLNGVWETR